MNSAHSRTKPHFEAKNGHVFGAPPCQVKLYLTWAKWLLTKVITEAHPIVLAMDETCLTFGDTGGKGNLLSLRPDKNSPHEITENVSLADRRRNITLVATITNDADLQQHLPQIILPRAKKTGGSDETPKGEWPADLASADAPVEVWTKTGGWMKATTLIHYLARVKSVVHKKRPGASMILVFDCHPSHYAVQALRYAARHFGFIILIPARLGYMFDILDTKVFLAHKRALYELYAERKIAQGVSRLTFAEWAGCVVQATRRILVQKHYAAEFSRHGLARNCTDLAPAIKNRIPGGGIEGRRLTEEEFRFLVGRNTTMHRLLFSGKRFEKILEHSSAASSSAPAVAIAHPLGVHKKKS